MTQKLGSESLRVSAFRRELISTLNFSSDPHEHSLGDLIQRYFVRARRLIAPVKRSVSFVPAFWNGGLVARHFHEVFALARIVEDGEDLTPYLSRRAHQPGQHPRDHQHDGDFLLAAYDVHHLHFDPINPAKPRKVRSKDKEDALLFATFGRASAVFIMVGTHKSPFDGTAEAAIVSARAQAGHMLLKGLPGESDLNAVQRTTLALKGVNTAASVGGKAVISSMVNSCGGSIRTVHMASFAAARVHEVDAILDDVEQARDFLGAQVPEKPEFSWHFDHTRLILYEAVSGTVFEFADQPR